MYLDPGFGGMLIQIIIALAAAGGAAVFALRKKIRALLTRRKDTAHVGQRQQSKEGEAGIDDIIDTLADRK